MVLHLKIQPFNGRALEVFSSLSFFLTDTRAPYSKSADQIVHSIIILPSFVSFVLLLYDNILSLAYPRGPMSLENRVFQREPRRTSVDKTKHETATIALLSDGDDDCDGLQPSSEITRPSPFLGPVDVPPRKEGPQSTGGTFKFLTRLRRQETKDSRAQDLEPRANARRKKQDVINLEESSSS